VACQDAPRDFCCFFCAATQRHAYVAHELFITPFLSAACRSRSRYFQQRSVHFATEAARAVCGSVRDADVMPGAAEEDAFHVSSRQQRHAAPLMLDGDRP